MLQFLYNIGNNLTDNYTPIIKLSILGQLCKSHPELEAEYEQRVRELKHDAPI